MEYQEKMTRHLRLAEALGDDVDAIEAQALRELGFTEIKNTIQAYQMRNHLEHHALLRQRAGARDLQIRLATMYGPAALMERWGS